MHVQLIVLMYQASETTSYEKGEVTATPPPDPADLDSSSSRSLFRT